MLGLTYQGGHMVIFLYFVALLLVFIVWWTMFSGRKNGELKDPEEPAPDAESRKE